MRDEIEKCIADNPNIPVLSHLEGATLDDIENMLVSHCAFTSRAMDHTDCSTVTIELENYVKLYLSYVLEFDNKNGFNSTKKSMMFDTSPVFLDLLNLFKQVQRFGPLVIFWEG